MPAARMTDKDKPYQPIPCAVYSEYELAIIRQHLLQVVWRDENNIEHISRLTPLDLQTENHAEFLIAQDHEQQRLKIRLDYILQYRILS